MRPASVIMDGLATLGAILVSTVVFIAVIIPHEGNALEAGTMLAASAIAFSSSNSATSFSFRCFRKRLPVIILVSSAFSISN